LQQIGEQLKQALNEAEKRAEEEASK
jgi:hypothetical protein